MVILCDMKGYIAILGAIIDLSWPAYSIGRGDSRKIWPVLTLDFKQVRAAKIIPEDI